MVAPSPAPSGSTLARDVVLYTLARLGLLIGVTAVLVLVGIPLVVAALLALVVALPLSVVLLRGLRARVVAGLAQRRRQRQAERDRLRAQLRGTTTDDPPGTT